MVKYFHNSTFKNWRREGLALNLLLISLLQMLLAYVSFIKSIIWWIILSLKTSNIFHIINRRNIDILNFENKNNALVKIVHILLLWLKKDWFYRLICLSCEVIGKQRITKRKEKSVMKQQDCIVDRKKRWKNTLHTFYDNSPNFEKPSKMCGVIHSFR